MRAAIYARISKDREGTGLGIDRQLTECRRLAAERGWEIDESWVLIENDTSATKGRRPKFSQLMRGIDRAAFDVVIALSVDRLARRMRDLLDLYESAIQRNVLIATTDGRLDLSTDGGRAQAILLGALAEIEIGNLQDRLKRKARQSIASGRPANAGSRPFGWEIDRMTQRPEEADVIRELSRRVLAGESLTSLCRDLNRRGILTPGKRAKDADGQYIEGQVVGRGRWTTPGLRRMLSRPRHAGIVTHNDVEVFAEDGQPVQAQWAPILPRDEWEQLQRALDRRHVEPNAGWSNRRSHLLTGLLVCGVCGERMGTSRSNGSRGGPPVWSYRCRRHTSRTRDLLDSYVLAAVVQRALDNPIQVDAWESVDQEEARRQIADKRHQLDQLEAEFVQSGGSVERLARLTAKLEAEIEAIENQRLDSLEVLTGAEWAQFDLSDLLASSASLLPPDEAGGDAKVRMIEQQRTSILMYARKITVHPVGPGRPGLTEESIVFDWREPGSIRWQAVIEQE